MLGVSVSSISFALVFVALCVALLVMAVKFTMTYVFVTILKMHPKHSFSVGFDLMQWEFGFIILCFYFEVVCYPRIKGMCCS